MKRSLGFVCLLISCAREQAAEVHVSLTTLRASLMASGGDRFEVARFEVRCANGARASAAVDLATDDTFEASVPACGAATLSLSVDRAPRTEEEGAVAAYRGELETQLVAGVNEIVLGVRPKGELQIDNTTDEACEAHVGASAPRAIAPGTSERWVLDPATYPIVCGALRLEDANITFAERTLRRIGKENAPPQRDPGGQARLLGPTRVFAGRKVLYDASASVDAAGAPARRFVWLRDGEEIAACRDRSLCAIDVPAGASGVALIARVPGRNPNEAEADATLQIVVDPAPARPASIRATGGTSFAGPSQARGGQVYLSAHGMVESTITSEPAPPLAPSVLSDPLAETCTLTIPDDACALGLERFVLGTSQQTIMPPATVVCDQGGSISSTNAALRHLRVIYRDDGMGVLNPCSALDLRGLGDVDVDIELQDGALFDFDGVYDTTSEGDGIFVSTLGKIHLHGADTSLIAINGDDGARPGLAEMSDYPALGEHSSAVISLTAAGEVRLSGALRIDPISSYPSDPGQFAVVLTSSSSDIVLDATIDLRASTTAYGNTPMLAASGARVFLPGLTGIDVSGSSPNAANGNSAAGEGGVISLRSDGGGVNAIALSSPIDTPLQLALEGGDAGSASGSSADGGRGGRLDIATDGAIGTLAIVGVARLDGGDGERSGGHAQSVSVRMSCSLGCDAALALDVQASGGRAEISSDPASITTGTGGAVSVRLTHTGGSENERATSLAISGSWALDGGACAPMGAAPFSSGLSAGRGGAVDLGQFFSQPAVSRPARAFTRLSSSISARGGSCGPVPLNPGASQSLFAGDGGEVKIMEVGHLPAEVIVERSTIDLRGGDVEVSGGDPAMLQVVAGHGGNFDLRDYELDFARASGETHVTLGGARILADGGTAAAENATLARGGDAGQCVASIDGAASSTFATEATSRASLRGGNASITAAQGTAFAGAGGRFSLYVSEPAYDPAFTSCVFPSAEIAPASGTASGGDAPSTGGSGVCEWVRNTMTTN